MGGVRPVLPLEEEEAGEEVVDLAGGIGLRAK